MAMSEVASLPSQYKYLALVVLLALVGEVACIGGGVLPDVDT